MTYELRVVTTAVNNPRYDGRKRLGADAIPCWDEGVKFVLKTQFVDREPIAGVDLPPMARRVAYPIGLGQHKSTENIDFVSELVVNSDPIEPEDTEDAIMVASGGYEGSKVDSEVIDVLVKRGLVTYADIVSAYKEVYEE